MLQSVMSRAVGHLGSGHSVLPGRVRRPERGSVSNRKARESMDAGATGLIFGRNVFQRGHDASLRFVAQLKEILAKYPS